MCNQWIKFKVYLITKYLRKENTFLISKSYEEYILWNKILEYKLPSITLDPFYFNFKVSQITCLAIKYLSLFKSVSAFDEAYNKLKAIFMNEYISQKFLYNVPFDPDEITLDHLSKYPHIIINLEQLVKNNSPMIESKVSDMRKQISSLSDISL